MSCLPRATPRLQLQLQLLLLLLLLLLLTLHLWAMNSINFSLGLTPTPRLVRE